MKTIKLRIKENNKINILIQMSNDVNTVWNYINNLSYTHLQRTGKFFSSYDMQHYLKGSSKELNISAQTIQAITEEYVVRRFQFKKAKLNWRVSNPKSSKRSLGWIPFKGQQFKLKDDVVTYNKKSFKVWNCGYDLKQFENRIRCGCFTQDAKGRWYICLVVKDHTNLKSIGTKEIGIDLGIKNIATLSDGNKIANPRFYNRYENKLAIAQRAKKKKLVRNIHAKIVNSRKDYLHKESTKLVKNYSAIYVGDVSAKRLIDNTSKTKMTKYILDSCFSSFKTMLCYKSQQAGVLFEEVKESYTTQTCSNCGVISNNSPKGRKGLLIRVWTCSTCNTTHDRDINAAKNILRLGHQTLSKGVP